jgi:hypothetical protein
MKPKSAPSRQSLEDLERAQRLQETVQVLAQPHRRGDDSDMTDALGLFVRIHCTHVADGRKVCERELYDGGNDYFRLVYRWRVATGVPVPLRLAEGETKDAGPRDGETLADWEKRLNDENHERLLKIKRCEEAMKCSGLPGFHAAQDLALDGKFPVDSVVGPVKRALHSLAMELGRFPF